MNLKPNYTEQDLLWVKIENNLTRIKRKKQRSIIVLFSCCFPLFLTFSYLFINSFFSYEKPKNLYLNLEELYSLKGKEETAFIKKNKCGLLEAELTTLTRYVKVAFNTTSIIKSTDFKTIGLVKDVSVPYGKRTSIYLPDGTFVHLNSGTRLCYTSYFNHLSEVYLDGEALFITVREQVFPLYIHTKDLFISMLSSSLYIQSYSNLPTSQIAVLDGHIELTTSKCKVNLTTNQVLKNALEFFNMTDINRQQYISWTKDTLDFTDTTLADIFDRLCFYYGFELELEESIRDISFTGKLRLNRSFNKLLDVISDLNDLDYIERDGTYYIYEKRSYLVS